MFAVCRGLLVSTLSAAIVLGGCRQEPGSQWEPYSGLELNSLRATASVIECQAPVVDAPIRMSEPVMRLGVVDGEPPYEFFRVAGVVRTADGHVLVADGGSKQLRIYAPDGRHLQSVGGEGAGPGEFNQIDWMTHSPRNTVTLWDSELARGTRYTTRGEFIDSFTLPSVPDYTLLHAEGVFADGTVLAQAGPPREATDLAGARWNVVGAYRLEPGAPADRVRFLGEFPSQYVPNEQCASATECLPEASGIWALWRTDADRLLYARADVPEILVFDMTVGSAQVIRVAEPNRRASPAGYIVPPYFDALHADDAGRIWARRYETRLWTVIDPTDGCRHEVSIPSRMTIHQIRGDFVAGTERDEFGLEQVVVYRMR